MARSLTLVFLLALAGCSGVARQSYDPSPSPSPSACVGNEASYACQIERYSNTNA
jgi:hypothetical protein